VASAVTLGLIPAPDIPEKIATELASELPDLLRNRVDGNVSWEVPVEVDPLTGTDREAPEILDACRDRMLSEDWDLALCLTDLPVYRDGKLVVADVSAKPLWPRWLEPWALAWRTRRGCARLPTATARGGVTRTRTKIPRRSPEIVLPSADADGVPSGGGLGARQLVR
jgi:hypothetical protein